MSLYSVSISGRITLDLHSLNNEGGEGNQTMTRQVTIVAPDENNHPRLVAVNAISGDMLKHIQAEHLHRICVNENLNLCEGCRVFSANRINADPDFIKSLGTEKSTKVAKNFEIMNRLLPKCTMDDLLGVLITEGNRSAPRKSVAEYGWVVALPELSHTENYFHVKYDPSRKSTQASTEAAAGSNLGQAIFHRPANSGVYAVVANFELWRIGFNDVAWNYAIADPKDRNRRAKALLQSVLYAFLQPNGAQRNTQNPHIVGFEGVISVSQQPVPAPTVSPIASGYREQLTGIRDALAPIVGQDAIVLHAFDDMQGFTTQMTGLLNDVQVYDVTTQRNTR